MDDNLAFLTNAPLVLLLVLLNGLFAVAEYALIRSNSTKLNSAEMKQRRGAASAMWLMGRLDLSLGVIQLSITVVTVCFAFVGVQFFHDLFTKIFGFQSAGTWFALSPGTSELVPLATAVAVVSLLHLVVVQIAAKSLAIQNPELALCLIGPVIRLLSEICRPILCCINAAANVFLLPFRTEVPEELSETPTTEISLLVSQRSEEGEFEEQEEEMLRGVFGFSKTVAREVMTPRTDLVTIKIDASYQDVIRIVLDTGFSRYPVVGRAIDDVRGVLLARDLLRIAARGDAEIAVPFSVEKIMRKAYFVPDTKPIDELLNEFKRRKQHMAIVLDEHGGVDGLVTLEDLLEEIVGDIFDESDDPQSWIQVRDDGDILVDGGVLVADLNQQLGLNLPEGDYDTIAGFIITALGRMPKMGDEIVVGAGGGVELAAPHQNGSSPSAEADAETQRGPEDSAADPELLIVVEKIENHRLAQARLKRTETTRKSETENKLRASQGEG